MSSGAQARTARLRLGMTPGEFASLLGVNTSTIYRWEVATRLRQPIDPAQGRLVQVVLAVTARDLGVRVRRRMILHGPMGALHELLNAAFETRRSK